jgi:ABC-type nitrate/sulfonate/bicarbonate transport system permease component
MSLWWTAWRYGPLLLLAAAWEGAAQAHLVSPYVLPPLSGVLVSSFHLMTDDLAYHTALSLMRGAIGLAAAIIVGVAAGVLMAWYRPVRRLLNPFFQLFYPLPKSALIPVAIVWLGLGTVSKIALIFVGVLLPIVVSTFNAVRGVDHLLVWSARSAGAREPALLCEIVIPAAAAEILNGIRVALALTFILVVAGELIFANDGLGYLISFLGEGGDYKGMFAGVLVISLLGFAADRLFVLVTRRVMAWQEAS